MSIPLTGSESLFVRLGHEIGGLNQLDTARGSALGTRTDTIYADFVNTDQTVVQGIFGQQDANRSANDQLAAYYQALTQSTLITMANDNSPLNPLDLPTAIAALDVQMISTTSGIQKPTVGATPTAASTNYGDATMVCSTTRFDGRQLDYIFAETINCVVTSDQDRGATAGGEPITYTGAPAVPATAWNWPQGSGAGISTTVINATNATLVTNGDFETWTSAVLPPSNWTILEGLINVDVLRNATVADVLSGNYSCEFLGDGSTLSEITQDLTLAPSTVYCMCVWLKKSATPATGVLRVRMIDNLSAVITNAQGAANSYNVTLTDSSVSTSVFRPFTMFWQTPVTLPPTITLDIALTTALESGKSLYIDRVALGVATQLYAGGPYAAVFSGGTPSQIGDYWTIAVTNSAGVTSFCRSLDRLWNLRVLNMFIPSITVGYIPDSLIT